MLEFDPLLALRFATNRGRGSKSKHQQSLQTSPRTTTITTTTAAAAAAATSVPWGIARQREGSTRPPLPGPTAGPTRCREPRPRQRANIVWVVVCAIPKSAAEEVGMTRETGRSRSRSIKVWGSFHPGNVLSAYSRDSLCVSHGGRNLRRVCRTRRV